MKKYACNVCSYIYDPANGDPDNGVPPGTAWDDVPEGWLRGKKLLTSMAAMNAMMRQPIMSAVVRVAFPHAGWPR